MQDVYDEQEGVINLIAVESQVDYMRQNELGLNVNLLNKLLYFSDHDVIGQ